jgi:hypothetical protein
MRGNGGRGVGSGEIAAKSAIAFTPPLLYPSSPSLAVSPMMRVVVAVAKLIGAVMVGIMMVEVVKSEIMAATHHDEQHKAP